MSTTVEIQKTDGISKVTTLYNEKPLKILTPQTHTKACHIVTSNYGGGMVQGDQVEFSLTCGKDTHTLLGTQANSRVYKSDTGEACSFNQKITVAEDSVMVQLNDPMVFQKGSGLYQNVEFNIKSSSTLLYLDWVAAGRVHFGELFDFNTYQSKLEISIDDTLAVSDNFVINPNKQNCQSPGLFSNHTTYINLYLVGQKNEITVKKVEEHFNEQMEALLKAQESQKPTLLATCDRISDDVFIVRASAVDMADLWKFITPLGEVLKDKSLLEFNPFSRKY